MNRSKGHRSSCDSSFIRALIILLSLSSFILIVAGNEDVSLRSEPDRNSATNEKSDGISKIRLPRVLDFKEYVIKFNKVYGPTELMAKANLFLARVINIFRHNAQFLHQKYNYFLGLNAFTDISAADFEAMGSDDDPALEAVHETKYYPLNMPANELPSVQQLTGSEGFSMSAADDDDDDDDDEQSTAEYEARYGNNNRVPIKRTLVDFTKDTTTIEGNNENVDIKEFYREFMKSLAPDEVERVSKVIDLNKKLNDNNDDDDDDDHGNYQKSDNEEEKRQKLLLRSDPKSERAMIRHNIKYKPVVKSNNVNYDEMHMISHGVHDNNAAKSRSRAFSERMAAFLDYDVFLMEDSEPYESPSAGKKSKIGDNENENDNGTGEQSSSYFSSFYATAKGLAKSLIWDSIFDDDDDEYDDFDDDNSDDETTTDKINERTRQEKEVNSKRIKYNVDWRVTGCITRPKSQDNCNACYAFTVVSLMEYYHCRQTRELTEFSAQYIVDCGRKLKLNGCKGGHLSLVGKFINQHGIELQAMYPFSGQDGKCPYNSDETTKMGYLRPKILNWIYIKKMSDWYEHIRKGPLLVGLAMPSDFLAYGGGIHDGQDCNPDKVHAMLLVGSGSQNGKQFWLFKNSFSSEWGENGYFRLAKDAPLKCFNSGVVVRVDFKQAETKNPEHEKQILLPARTT